MWGDLLFFSTSSSLFINGKAFFKFSSFSLPQSYGYSITPKILSYRVQSRGAFITPINLFHDKDNFAESEVSSDAEDVALGYLKKSLNRSQHIGSDDIMRGTPHAEIINESCTESDLYECYETRSEKKPTNSPLIEKILSTYLGPRAILAAVAVLYATNFSLGAIMNDYLPASAATSNRMLLASLVLSPFLTQLKPNLRTQVLIGGCFVSLGYITQSLALVDTSPALVSFLGSATVIVCPLLQWLVDKKPMGFKDAPQTWLSVILCLSGVATLELLDSYEVDSSASFTIDQLFSRLGTGDVLSLIQALGFGTGMFVSEKMIKKEPSQALPITAGMVATTAFISMIWCFVDGWIGDPDWESLGIPGIFFDPNKQSVALAVAWTGILSTSTNFFIEITALGKVPSAEASVILATEPLWASLFAALLLNEQFSTSDYIGGMLMISACLVNSVKPSDVKYFITSVKAKYERIK